MRYIGSKIYDLRFGKQSNIPSCCIFAFTFLNWGIFLYNRRDKGIFKKLYKLKHKDANYSECPICILRKRKPNKLIRGGYADMGIKGYRIDHPFFFSYFNNFSEKKWWLKSNRATTKDRKLTIIERFKKNLSKRLPSKLKSLKN